MTLEKRIEALENKTGSQVVGVYTEEPPNPPGPVKLVGSGEELTVAAFQAKYPDGLLICLEYTDMESMP